MLKVLVIAPPIDQNEALKDDTRDFSIFPDNVVICGRVLCAEDIENQRIDTSTVNVLLSAWYIGGDVVGPIVAKLPNLEWIHTITAAASQLLCKEIIENDSITLTNAKGIFSEPLAEFVLASCFHFCKQIPTLLQNKNDHIWPRFLTHRTPQLRGQTMGIIGYGDIGQACARYAKAFGMRVVGTRRRPELSQEDPFIDLILGTNGLLDVLGQSDYIVIVAPSTKDTLHLIGEKELDSAKEGSSLINIGRGNVIDEEALTRHLQNKTKIHGAALDVFKTEPLPPSSPLWDLPNVLISPHTGGIEPGFRSKNIELFKELLVKKINNLPLDNVVDKKLGY